MNPHSAMVREFSTRALFTKHAKPTSTFLRKNVLAPRKKQLFGICLITKVFFRSWAFNQSQKVGYVFGFRASSYIGITNTANSGQRFFAIMERVKIFEKYAG
jgi:hypothetical protein